MNVCVLRNFNRFYKQLDITVEPDDFGGVQYCNIATEFYIKLCVQVVLVMFS